MRLECLHGLDLGTCSWCPPPAPRPYVAAIREQHFSAQLVGAESCECGNPRFREHLTCLTCADTTANGWRAEIAAFEQRIEDENLDNGSPYRFHGGLRASINSAYAHVAWRTQRNSRLHREAPILSTQLPRS